MNELFVPKVDRNRVVLLVNHFLDLLAAFERFTSLREQALDILFVDELVVDIEVQSDLAAKGTLICNETGAFVKIGEGQQRRECLDMALPFVIVEVKISCLFFKLRVLLRRRLEQVLASDVIGHST